MLDRAVQVAASEPSDLTPLVKAARSGLRRDVAALIEALAEGELLIPLARGIAGAPEGERVELEGALEIVPHMLCDEGGAACAALFTQAELLEPVASSLSWTTDDGALQFCSVAAENALGMALEVIDEQEVVGLLVNPGSESELFLRRAELSNMLAGRAIPLVGYVQTVAGSDDAGTLIAEQTVLPSDPFLSALEACLATMPEVSGHSLCQTFNPERDLEPHPTLRLRTSAPEAALQSIANRVIAAVGEHVPPPGYVDIVFDRDVST